MSKIFYIIRSRFSDDIEPDGTLVTYYDGAVESHPPLMVMSKLNLLEFFTRDLVTRHFHKLLSSKKTAERARGFAEMVED